MLKRLLRNIEDHGDIRRTLRQRKIVAIPATDVPAVKEAMDAGKGFMLPAQEGECELRIRRKFMDKTLLNETAAFLMENTVYPYSVHLPSYRFGKDEKSAMAVDHINTISDTINPVLYVLHVSKHPLKEWAREVRRVLSGVPRSAVIALENIGIRGSKMRFPDRVSAVLEAIGNPVPDNLAFCLDTTHVVPPTPGTTEKMEEETKRMVQEFIRTMGTRLRHVHLSNTRFDGEQKLQHLPLDEGFLEMGSIKSALADLDYKGKAVLELDPSRVGEGILQWNRI